MEGDYTPMVSYIMNTFFPPLLVIIVAKTVSDTYTGNRSPGSLRIPCLSPFFSRRTEQKPESCRAGCRRKEELTEEIAERVAEAVLERLNAERSECVHARHCPIRIDCNIYGGRNIIAPNAQTAVQNIREAEEKDTPE